MMTARPRAARRPSLRPRPALTADSCPTLAPGVAFEEAGGAWLATIHGVPSSRLSRTVVDLLTAMDGRTPLQALHGRFAPAEPAEGFLRLIERFRDNGLLAGDARRPPGRLTYRPPFTVQVATLRAAPLFARLDRAIIPLPRRVLRAGVGAVLGAGMLAAAVQADELRSALSRPVPLLGLLVVLVALALTTLLHEAAHGLTLTRLGGRPRRAGVMLFYLTPAFFVDVTDGWRLADRRHRVAVALAGPAVHGVVAALALLAALAVPRSPTRETLQILALACLVVVLVNLIPFVRFDGYLALMSALDEPNLRGRAIRDGANALSRVLFGGARTPRSLNRWWSAPFGLASLVTPVVLVLLAVTRAAQALSAGGPGAGLFVVVMEATVAAVGVVLLGRALVRVVRAGASRIRVVTVTVVLATSLAVAGSLIPVPLTATLGFSVEGGRVVLVRAEGDGGAAIPDGGPVILQTRGLLGTEQRGEGTVRARPVAGVAVPVEALFPVRVTGATVPAEIVADVEVTGGADALPPAGQARVALGESPLWAALWRMAIVSPLSGFGNEEERG